MKRHDEKEMHGLYIQWIESGQSKTLFAKERDIVPTTFYYWAKKFQVRESPPSSSVRNRGFSLLTVQDSPQARNREPVARINYPSGISVELYGMPAAGFIKALTE